MNSTARLATRLARRGARVVLCGIPPASDTFATLDVVSKAFMIRSVFGAPRSARRSAVDAFVDGRLQPGLLVTHEFDLSDVATALGLIADRQPGVGKILLRP